ncbi:MAG: 30S ribosomal protein S21 [Planctomycetes bacterium]|nr:30S ribosomal protein S21 [Planctomycetota bacterium]
MIKVQVRSNEPLEAALRRFKRQCNYAGVFRLAKKYNFHEKRSDRRRREERERIRNIQRAIRKAEEKVRPSRRKKSKVKVSQATPGAEGEGESEGQVAAGAATTPREDGPVSVDQVNAAEAAQRPQRGGVDISTHVGNAGD